MKTNEENNDVLQNIFKSENKTSETARSDASQSGLFCPNCGSILQAQKCKLFCRTSGYGYRVTCSKW